MEIIFTILAISILLLCGLYVALEVIPSGTKGITKEYTSPSGKKRTATKDREKHIVWFILGDSIHVLYFRMGMGYWHKHISSISML